MLRTFAIFFLVLPTLTFAQDFATDQGSLLVGGTAGFVTDGDNNILQLNPNVQYFVARQFALGATLNMVTDFDDIQFLGGPAVSYYFGGEDRSLVPFVSGRARFGDIGGDLAWDVTAAAGALLLLNRHVGVTGEAFYTHSDTGVGSDDVGGVSFGIAAFVF